MILYIRIELLPPNAGRNYVMAATIDVSIESLQGLNDNKEKFL